MRRYKKRSRRWKRIWRGDGVSGGGSKLENWILRLIMRFSERSYARMNRVYNGYNDLMR